MHRAKHLFEQVCSMRNLCLAAREALRGKRSRLPGARFFADQEKELAALHMELSSGICRHGPYHYFWIHDPKDRLVAAAGTTTFEVPQDRAAGGISIKELAVGSAAAGRYVKVFCKNNGLLPAWHNAPGVPGHMMLDEILVNPVDEKK